MTAPGNSVVLILLLAAFLACTGYAGGRLHQWYRMGQERDEAYRDGYDTATRTVFSMAARIISPRRTDRSAIRASAAVVIPASAVVETATSPLPPTAPPPAGASRSPYWTEAAMATPASQVRADVPPADSSTPWEIFPDDPARPLVFRSLPGPRLTRPRQDAFAEPAGVGKPDGEATAMAREDRPEMSPGGRSQAPDAEPSGGRHMVPDELVQAATYRLPPDRVARAKVRDANTPSELSADPASWLPPVPKPRSNRAP
jgi:hypothetical protein